MSTTGIVILIVVLVAAGAAILFWFSRERSRKLRERFGPEYNRAIQETGSASRAEKKLDHLQKRVERLAIHPLSPLERDRFAESWVNVQAAFVDDPGLALTQADELLQRVMSARGYPMTSFEERAEEISVDHAHVVQNYRAGHLIAKRHLLGQATTEDLRQAMVHYRTLFDELIAEPNVVRVRHASAG